MKRNRGGAEAGSVPVCSFLELDHYPESRSNSGNLSGGGDGGSRTFPAFGTNWGKRDEADLQPPPAGNFSILNSSLLLVYFRTGFDPIKIIKTSILKSLTL
jgi:hypothetical protein